MGSSNSTKNIDPETFSPTARVAGEHENVGFLSLPREVRNQIYLNLVVAEDPIQYDKNFESLSYRRTFADTAMKWMFDVESNSRIAEETREIFYQHNTFLVYTHDIEILLKSKTHAMWFRAGKNCTTEITYSTPFDAGAWVRKLAVRVGWHASGGWFTDSCCEYPASDLRLLLDQASLRSVIIDARFGAWPFGIPQGIGWDLLYEMNTKWGKEFRIYNDQTLTGDTRLYTSDRRDISETLLQRLLQRIWGSQNNEGVETESAKSEQEDAGEGAETASANSEEEDASEGAETASATREQEDASEDDEASQHPSWSDYEDEERGESSEEVEAYQAEYIQQEARRSVTSEVQAGGGSDEDESGAWSVGEKLIIQAGERLIQSARTGERWGWDY